RIWDTASGQTIEIAAGAEPVARAVFDPAGAFVLSVSAGGSAAVWDARTGAAVTRFGLGRAGDEAVTHASFGPDGTRIVAVLVDGTARVVDTRTGRLVSRLQEPQAGPDEAPGIIESARFDP